VLPLNLSYVGAIEDVGAGRNKLAYVPQPQAPSFLYEHENTCTLRRQTQFDVLAVAAPSFHTKLSRQPHCAGGKNGCNARFFFVSGTRVLLVNFLFLYAPSTAREKRGSPTADNDNERARGSGYQFRPPSPNIIFRERIL
jgi:hypothetical protein